MYSTRGSFFNCSKQKNTVKAGVMDLTVFWSVSIFPSTGCMLRVSALLESEPLSQPLNILMSILLRVSSSSFSYILSSFHVPPDYNYLCSIMQTLLCLKWEYSLSVWRAKSFSLSGYFSTIYSILHDGQMAYLCSHLSTTSASYIYYVP